MLHLQEGLRVERIGDEAIVIDAATNQTHRISGDGVRALELVAEGIAEGDVPADLHRAVDRLIEAGLVATTPRWTRRRFLVAGSATFAAATVTSFLLADPAAAASKCAVGSGTASLDTTGPGTFEFFVGPTTTSLTVAVWGAGGGGAGNTGGHDVNPGAGGGGGGFATSTVTVVPCTSYTYRVGKGYGSIGPDNNGIPGETSAFGSGTASISGPATVFLQATGGGGGVGKGTGGTPGVGSVNQGTGQNFKNGGSGGAVTGNWAGAGGGASGNNAANGNNGATQNTNTTNGSAGGTAAGTAPLNGAAGGKGGNDNGFNGDPGAAGGGGGGGGGDWAGTIGGTGGNGRVRIVVNN